MDEAASRLRMEVDSKPEAIDELDRRIVQLKIEREALKKESDPASRDRLERLVKELEELEQRSAELTAQWQAEKDKLAGAQKLKEQLDQARAELDIVQRRGDWSRAGELTYGVIPELERKLKEAESSEAAGCSRKPSPRSTSPASCRAGPAYRSTRCCRASAKSSSTWSRICAAG